MRAKYSTNLDVEVPLHASLCKGQTLAVTEEGEVVPMDDAPAITLTVAEAAWGSYSSGETSVHHKFHARFNSILRCIAHAL